MGNKTDSSLPASGFLPSRLRLLLGLFALSGVNVLQRCCPLPPGPSVLLRWGIPGSDTHKFRQKTEKQPLCLDLVCLTVLFPFLNFYLLS